MTKAVTSTGWLLNTFTTSHVHNLQCRCCSSRLAGEETEAEKGEGSTEFHRAGTWEYQDLNPLLSGKKNCCFIQVSPHNNETKLGR